MAEDWKNRGFTQIPNIAINNPAIPKCVRNTYIALSARAFGKRFSVSMSEQTLANDVGCSRMTISRHLAVLEAFHLIRRIRIGRGLTNTIILTLKVSNPESLTQSISRGTKGLSERIIKRERTTMKEALVMVTKHKRRKKESLAIQEALEVLAKHPPLPL